MFLSHNCYFESFFTREVVPKIYVHLALWCALITVWLAFFLEFGFSAWKKTKLFWMSMYIDWFPDCECHLKVCYSATTILYTSIAYWAKNVIILQLLPKSKRAIKLHLFDKKFKKKIPPIQFFNLKFFPDLSPTV